MSKKGKSTRRRDVVHFLIAASLPFLSTSTTVTFHAGSSAIRLKYHPRDETIGFEVGKWLHDEYFAALEAGSSLEVETDPGALWTAWESHTSGRQQLVATWRVGAAWNTQHFSIDETARRLWQWDRRTFPSFPFVQRLGSFAAHERVRASRAPLGRFFSAAECAALLEVVRGVGASSEEGPAVAGAWSFQADSVDGAPEVQADFHGEEAELLMSFGQSPEEFRGGAAVSIDAMLQRLLRAGQWFMQMPSLYISYVFVRRYAACEEEGAAAPTSGVSYGPNGRLLCRDRLRTHPDISLLTATVLLSSPTSFEGGDYYLCSNQSWHRVMGDTMRMQSSRGNRSTDPYDVPAEALERVLGTQANQWKQDFGSEPGAISFHTAGALHGVTRLRKATGSSSTRNAIAERYSLVAFYESSDFEATSAPAKAAKAKGAMPEEGGDQRCRGGDQTRDDWTVDAVEYYRRFE